MFSQYHVPGNSICSLFFVLCYLLRAVRRTEAHLVNFPLHSVFQGFVKVTTVNKMKLYMNIHAKVFVYVGLYLHSLLFYLYLCVCVCVHARARGRVYCCRSQNLTQ